MHWPIRVRIITRPRLPLFVVLWVLAVSGAVLAGQPPKSSPWVAMDSRKAVLAVRVCVCEGGCEGADATATAMRVAVRVGKTEGLGRVDGLVARAILVALATRDTRRKSCA